MLAALSDAIEERDPSTRGHSLRVTELAEAVARWLEWDEHRLTVLRIGAPLHDIGKLAIADRILRKCGPLDAIELAQVRAHPVVGARLVGRIPLARPGLPYVLYHHERWDGGGYPTGRSGVEIPIEARVLAVADAYDAMTSTRPYRSPLDPVCALEELDRCAGSQFDPTVVRAFLEVWGTGARATAAAS
jgi:putative nucleotidyltransferase with HDIG domain